MSIPASDPYCEQATKAPEPEPFLGYGGFWARVVAAFLDGIIVSVLSSIVVALLSPILNKETLDSLTDSGFLKDAVPFVSGSTASFLISLAYQTAMNTGSHQASLGKMAMGLRVVTDQGLPLSVPKAAIRELAKILSSMILGIGFLMVAFSSRKQGLHDKIAGTLVVRSR
ncbi:MAG: RDD family protein [Isosphaeraceae bacterium]